jgi:hypothetical protein
LSLIGLVNVCCSILILEHDSTTESAERVAQWGLLACAL